MYIEPLNARHLPELKAFLLKCGLRYDENVSYTACLMEDDSIIATASLDGCTIKCVAVDPAHQGEDLTARLITDIRAEANRRGIHHLMLYTKPRNKILFRDLGFYPIIESGDVLMMENRRTGIQDYLASVHCDAHGTIGCAVQHCDPFTLGHRHIIETAARECDFVYVFILSEDRGMFPAADRIQIVREGTRDLPNVRVCETGPYMISSATFPTYFLRESINADDVRCETDVRLFGKIIAPALGIARRYVGTEPLDPVTNRYNQLLARDLPEYGVELRMIDRIAAGNRIISARTVRQHVRAGEIEGVRDMLPDTTWRYLTAQNR